MHSWFLRLHRLQRGKKFLVSIGFSFDFIAFVKNSVFDGTNTQTLLHI